MLVWPDLVYIELICMVALTVLLLVWSIALSGPTGGGSQYGDDSQPVQGTVVLPRTAGDAALLRSLDGGSGVAESDHFRTVAIPYLDFNKEGNGYYTINQRRFAYLTFQFGFLVLWILLMLIGTFFRGPNWSFFGFFETWDVHKVEALNNVQLSERFWIDLLNYLAGSAVRIGRVDTLRLHRLA